MVAVNEYAMNYGIGATDCRDGYQRALSHMHQVAVGIEFTDTEG